MSPGADQPMREAARAAIEAYVASADLSRIHHTVQVTSFGGSGTSALCAHLMQAGVDLQPGPAHWPYKHRRRPPSADEVPEGFRVIYPVGDPRDAVLSVFRRGLQIGHFESLHDRSPRPEEAARLVSAEAFLAAGIDDFELADHFAQWSSHPPGYPVMFVQVEQLGQVWGEVATFAGLPPDAPPFVHRSRHSDWRSIEPRWRAALDDLYGELAGRIAELPAVSVVR